ncbi:MAG: hypothetical protein NTY35_00070 [Planctomycetota bacterium]|nr:hypothetical protein [Planctomycetota bacterium]
MTKVSTTRFWSDVVSLRPRFQRSAHLERDFHGEEWLRGYVVTPLARSILSRVVGGLARGRTSRAWSLTGPYGTGKSAFALFLSHALASGSEGDLARKLLREADPELHRSLFGKGGLLPAEFGLHPVLATGQPKRIEAVLLDALVASLENFWQGGGSKPEILQEVIDAAKRVKKGEFPSPKEVVELFEKSAKQVAASKRSGQGLLIILDEAGRVLELAARGVSHGDVHLLQELAEAASRSEDVPIVFVVMLHQAFDQYASRLSNSKRTEWAKIQGRFEDIPFQESSDQVVRLVGAALNRERLSPALTKRIEAECAEVQDLLPEKAEGDFAELLAAVAPLHPLAALALGPLFRSRLAQNERSLFAFLGSSEPHGFRQHLEGSPVNGDVPYYRLDQLYDYVVAAFGGRLYGQQGHTWALVETCIRRLPKGAERIDERVLKLIGLLGMFGEAMGVRASEQAVIAALQDGAITADVVRDSLARLQSASLLVYRKYQNSFQLWEGSDLDIDALVQKAHGQVHPDDNLPRRLTRLAPPRPVVARKHLFETGTLRYFEVRYADETLFDGDQEHPATKADGLIWLIIPTKQTTAEELIVGPGSAMRYWNLEASKRPILVGLPREAQLIRSLAGDLLALEHVRASTPELQSDAVARRELLGRISEVERLLREQLTAVLTDGRKCQWVNGGRDHSADGTVSLTRVVSNLCDLFYKSAPWIHHELINRSALSSAAASAQRELMQAMILRGDRERLGIEGNPPEYSMYASILRAHGMHAEQGDGRWAFQRPRGKARSFKAAWDKIVELLEQGESKRFTLSSIYEVLSSPPLGIKTGVQPVLLLATVLANRDDVAVYEDGGFVPDITPAFIERMLRQPSKIEVQLLRLGGDRAKIFEELKGLLTQPAGSKTTLVTIARALSSFAGQLPAYTRTTRQIDDRTRAVREALLRGKEPAQLLFAELPNALGIEPISSSAGLEGKEADGFVTALRGSLRELKQAYPKLLDHVRSQVSSAFGLPSEMADLRAQAQRRANAVLELTGDVGLKAFLLRLAEPSLGDHEWLVSMGTLLAGKPPASWHDQDLERARVQLVRLSQGLVAVEAMAIARKRSKEGDLPLMRIAVATSAGGELDHVVAISEKDEPHIRALAERLRKFLQEDPNVNKNGAVAAAALACRTLIEELTLPTPADTAGASR